MQLRIQSSPSVRPAATAFSERMAQPAAPPAAAVRIPGWRHASWLVREVERSASQVPIHIALTQVSCETGTLTNAIGGKASVWILLDVA